MAEHTKGPLTLGKLGVIKGGKVHTFTNGESPSQLFMAMAGLDMSHEERDANAAHMVRCWNMHYEMLTALQLIESVYRQNCVAEGEPSSVLAELQRVIAKAGAPC